MACQETMETRLEEDEPASVDMTVSTIDNCKDWWLYLRSSNAHFQHYTSVSTTNIHSDSPITKLPLRTARRYEFPFVGEWGQPIIILVQDSVVQT
jgi:hypothetical protein